MGVIGSRLGPEEGASDFRPGDCFGVEGEDETATKLKHTPINGSKLAFSYSVLNSKTQYCIFFSLL